MSIEQHVRTEQQLGTERYTTTAGPTHRVNATATVPGAGITATLDGWALRVRLEHYRRSDDRTLQRHLESLAKLLWAARTKAWFATVGAALDAPRTGESPPVGERDVAYVAARARIVACGRSADGMVTVTTTGMRDWQVRVAPGTARHATRRALAVAVEEAGAALIEDQLRQVLALKRTIWQPTRLPIATRRAEPGL